MKNLLLLKWAELYKSTTLSLEKWKDPVLCNLGWKEKWKSHRPVLEAHLYFHLSQEELLLEHKYKAFYFYFPVPQSTCGKGGLSDQAQAAPDSDL